MRFRIALATALAVAVIPALILTLLSTTPAASARDTRHVAVAEVRGPEHAVALKSHLMSYAQAVKVAQLVDFAQAVELQKEESYLRYVTFMHYLEEVAYLKAVASAEQQQAAARQAAAAQVDPAPAAAPTPAPAPAPAASPAAGGSDATSTNTPDWACIREHESGDDYSDYNGGAYQFEDGTWTSVTGLPGPAENYPPSVQDAAALKLYAERGFEPWTTRYVCGL